MCLVGWLIKRLGGEGDGRDGGRVETWRFVDIC